MKSGKNADWRSLCAELRPGDGVPPHIQKKKDRQARSGSRSQGSHHDRQYGKIVRRILDAELSSFANVPGLSVAAVGQQPGGSVLLIAVQAAVTSLAEIVALEALLQSAAGGLRAAVAAETCRKRVPHFRFRVIPASEEG